MHQTAVGQSPHPRHTFVDGMVDLEVLSLQLFMPLSLGVVPEGEDPDVVLRALADRQAIARDAAGLVDQGRGGRPMSIVEHGVGQRRQDLLVRVLVAHGDSSFTIKN